MCRYPRSLFTPLDGGEFASAGRTIHTHDTVRAVRSQVREQKPRTPPLRCVSPQWVTQQVRAVRLRTAFSVPGYSGTVSSKGRRSVSLGEATPCGCHCLTRENTRGLWYLMPVTPPCGSVGSPQRRREGRDRDDDDDHARGNARGVIDAEPCVARIRCGRGLGTLRDDGERYGRDPVLHAAAQANRAAGRDAVFGIVAVGPAQQEIATSSCSPAGRSSGNTNVAVNAPSGVRPGGSMWMCSAIHWPESEYLPAWRKPGLRVDARHASNRHAADGDGRAVDEGSVLSTRKPEASIVMVSPGCASLTLKVSCGAGSWVSSSAPDRARQDRQRGSQHCSHDHSEIRAREAPRWQLLTHGASLLGCGSSGHLMRPHLWRFPAGSTKAPGRETIPVVAAYSLYGGRGVNR